MDSYEKAAKEIVPAARAMIARQLSEKYNMTECRIAAILGIAQAAVSKYLNSKQSEVTKALSARISDSYITDYIEKIAAGDTKSLNMCICSICCSINDFGCSFSSFKSGKAQK